MRILIIGSNGMLGSDVVKVFNNYELSCTTIRNLDITKLEIVLEYFEKTKPEYIINCSAYTNVDGAEENFELAFAVNEVGVRNLAIACYRYNCTLIHISTDYVFDGELGREYIEDDKPNPLNIYGESKLKGELAVKRYCKKYYIVRTQWLFGVNGNNFIKNIIKIGRERKSLKVVNDQYGCPTFTKDLAKAIEILIQTNEYGIYHITNSGITTWYEFTKEIFNQLGEDIEILSCTTIEFPTPASRPKYAVLENRNWKKISQLELRNHKEALNDYLIEEKMICK